MHLSMYSSSRLYAKNPVFEIAHEESVKVYHLHMYKGNVQQNSLCVESCVTEEFNISPRFSLHLRLPAAVAKLAVFLSLFEELPNTSTPEYNLRRGERKKSLTEYKMKEVPNIDLRREDTKKSQNGILIGQCAQFLIHPSPI